MIVLRTSMFTIQIAIKVRFGRNPFAGTNDIIGFRPKIERQHLIV